MRCEVVDSIELVIKYLPELALQHQSSERVRNYSLEENPNFEKVVDEVLRWLSRPSNHSQLLVFDNVGREFPASSANLKASM